MNAHPLLKPLAVTCLVWLGLLNLVPVPASADTVQIPIGQQGQEKQNLQRPVTGMSQEQVRTEFGNPINWTNPVGEPPISKWTYADFVVYFEYDHVIHSVLRHVAQPDIDSNNGSNAAAASDATAVLRGLE